MKAEYWEQGLFSDFPVSDFILHPYWSEGDRAFFSGLLESGSCQALEAQIESGRFIRPAASFFKEVVHHGRQGH
jgi:hypothetical protein